MMDIDNPGFTTRIPRHPIFRIVASFPIACFSGALLTDIAYALTAHMMWADFSAWLLAVGMIMGVLAAVVGLVIIVGNRRRWTPRSALALVIGSLLVLILAAFNNLVHSRDAWTSVVPFGLALSAITVVLMLITVWLSAAPAYQHYAVVPASGVSE
jgi:uncharacterized membrane protein